MTVNDGHVTISDVARRAGLSVATVSRVMHNSPRASADARLRVRDAIDALGYTPNALARGLAMRHTRTIGVLVSSIADPFWAQVVCGIEDYAHQQQYAVLIASAYEDADRERSALELFRHKRVDGIIVGASSGGPEAVLGKRWQHLPLVFVNNEHIAPDDALLDAGQAADRAAAHLVSNDDMRSAAAMTEHLLALGHRRIGYVGAAGRASSLRRQQGFQQTLQRAGLPDDESLVVVLDEGPNEGELAAFRLLSRADRPTALFCYDDVMALGALRAVRALNLRVPEDVSVVGFDDIPLAAYVDPPLTTVRQPMYEMGQQAMMTLLRLFGGAEAPRVTVMHGDVIIRASSRAVAWHGSPGPANRS